MTHYKKFLPFQFLLSLFCVVLITQCRGTAEKTYTVTDGDGIGGIGKIFTPKDVSSLKYTMIYLHGVGSLETDIAERFLERHGMNKWKIIMPIATRMVGRDRAWVDIPKGRGKDAIEDEEGYRTARGRIRRIMDAEMRARGITSDNILLVGHSLGGSLAYYVALEYPNPLMGLVVVSSWIPLVKTPLRPSASWPKQPIVINDQAKTLPIYHVHGKDDTDVPFDLGAASAFFLKGESINVTTNFIEGEGHQFSNQSSIIDMVGNFITQLVQRKESASKLEQSRNNTQAEEPKSTGLKRSKYILYVMISKSILSYIM